MTEDGVEAVKKDGWHTDVAECHGEAVGGFVPVSAGEEVNEERNEGYADGGYAEKYEDRQSDEFIEVFLSTVGVFLCCCDLWNEDSVDNAAS